MPADTNFRCGSCNKKCHSQCGAPLPQQTLFQHHQIERHIFKVQDPRSVKTDGCNGTSVLSCRKKANQLSFSSTIICCRVIMIKVSFKANMHRKWVLLWLPEFYCHCLPHTLYLMNESSMQPDLPIFTWSLEDCPCAILTFWLILVAGAWEHHGIVLERPCLIYSELILVAVKKTRNKHNL